jgi:serine/threonine protein kinase
MNDVNYRRLQKKNSKFWREDIKQHMYADELLSSEFKNLINGMLEFDPAERLSIE